MASLPIWQNPTSSFSRLSLTAFEPKRSFAGFTRLAYRHQYRPRDGSVVSSLHCMNDPQSEGHMASYIGRRKFLATLASAAAAWPLAARAQQPAMPVIGFIRITAPNDSAPFLAAFKRGLGESGYVEGQNVAIEDRYAFNQVDSRRQWSQQVQRLSALLGQTLAGLDCRSLRRGQRGLLTRRERAGVSISLFAQ